MLHATIAGDLPWDQQNDFQRATTLDRAKRRGMHASGHPAWPSMLAAARELGWPRAFAADLYIHNVAALRVDLGEPFLWALGETGTQLTWKRDMCLADAREHVAYLEENRPAIFFWTGATLYRCTSYDARAVLQGFAFGDPEGWSE